MKKPPGRSKKKRKGPKILRAFKQVRTSPCPMCNEVITGALAELSRHYVEQHGRKPSIAEFHRFRTYSAKRAGKGYSTGYDSHPREVSGGLPSLGRRS